MSACVETSSTSTPAMETSQNNGQSSINFADQQNQSQTDQLSDSENPADVAPGTVNQSTQLLQNEIDEVDNVYIRNWVCESDLLPVSNYQLFLHTSGAGIFVGFVPVQEQLTVSWAGLKNDAVYLSFAETQEERIWRNISFKNMFEFSADRFADGMFQTTDICVLSHSDGSPVSADSSSFVTRAFYLNGTDRNSIESVWNCNWGGSDTVLTLFSDRTGNLLSGEPPRGFTVTRWDATARDLVLELGNTTQVFHLQQIDRVDADSFTVVETVLDSLSNGETTSAAFGAASCVKAVI